jgi:outer membrane receptor protein involved in Fe transport
VRRINFDQLVFNFNLDDEIIDTGNLSMVPESSWLTTVFAERRVFNQKGRIGLGGFYRLIEDHIDREPRPGGSGPGNIGAAYARGLQLTGRYEVHGNPDMLAVIKAGLTLQESEVSDPFTGQNRRLRGVPDRVFKLEFRQEFLPASLDYVLDMVWTSDRYYSDYNYHEIRSLSRPTANLKANYQASDNLQLWLEVRGLFDFDEDRYRERFAGDISHGQVSRYEQWLDLEDRQFRIGLQGYF